jgi:hypothetical protein
MRFTARHSRHDDAAIAIRPDAEEYTQGGAIGTSYTAAKSRHGGSCPGQLPGPSH